jgi:hypothetical protein
MTDHKVVGREEWQAARAELLKREKEHTRMGDELARQRRELPWVAIEKDYRFDTDDGTRTLAELFDGLLPHLHARDVTLLLVSRAPLAKLQAYKRRMGWSLPWVSSANTDFNVDFGASSTQEQLPPVTAAPEGGLPPDRGPDRGRGRDRCPRLSLGIPGDERLCPPGRGRLPDLRDHLARSRVPDGLLPDPGPGAEGARRG